MSVRLRKVRVPVTSTSALRAMRIVTSTVTVASVPTSTVRTVVAKLGRRKAT